MRKRSDRMGVDFGVWLLALAFLGACVARPAYATLSTVHHKRPQASTQTTKKKSHHHHYHRQPPGQKAPTPDRVKEIQSALSREGFYQGEPNGKMDSNTVAALQKFQSAHGLDASGKLDAPTLQKMGLGSDVAGVSAPKPATPPSCCSTSSPGSSSTLASSQHTSCCSVASTTAGLRDAAGSSPVPDQKAAAVDPSASAHPTAPSSGSSSTSSSPH